MAFYDDIGDESDFTIQAGSNPIQAFAVFAKGYRNAAAMLAAHLLNADRFTPYDAYPAVFLYRHALELYLKHVIYNSALLSHYTGQDHLIQRLQNDHGLPELSKKAALILRTLFPGDSDLEHVVDMMRSMSDDFHKIDPLSFSFRYPIDTKGEPTRSKQIINLTALHTRMTLLLDHLALIDFGLNVETDLAETFHTILDDP